MTQFSKEKFEQVVLYLLRRCSSERPGQTALLKMLYYTDLYHYRRHLTSVTGAKYVALDRGPVVDGYRETFSTLERRGILDRHEVSVQGYTNKKLEFKPLQQPDMSFFSETELDVMDKAIRKCKGKSGAELSYDTHSGAWSFIYRASDQGREMPYVSFRWIDNAPDDDDLEAAAAALADPDVVKVLESLRAA